MSIGMNLYSEQDYKKAIRERMKELNALGKPVTLKSLAEKIPVQYTYLSRALAGEDKHLGDDHLFTLCKLLKFSPDEIEYLMLLRAEATTDNLNRKKHLQTRIAHIKETKNLKANLRGMEGYASFNEIDYLFEPLCIVVHVSLGIEEFRKTPHRLASVLGITRNRLREVLRKLRDIGFIEMNSEEQITQVTRAHMHYTPDHPLMRAQQNLLRTSSLSYLSKADEEDRHSFMVTFSADPNAFHQIKENFQKYIQEVEKTVVAASNKSTYQMMFDVFKWV